MNKEYIIRLESEQDYSDIYTLIKIAFSTAKVKDGDEQDYAVNLRNGINYIPELALVVEGDGKLIAHIMLTKIGVVTPNGIFEALLLAPISVLLEYRDQRVGSTLIKESIVRARLMGHKAVFLCGDPMYYNRFGFKATSSFGINNVNDIPEQYVMVYELELDWSSYLYPHKELSHKFYNFMAMKRRKTYDRAFKENAVNLSHSRSDLSSLARELGISSDSLYRWRKESQQKGSERFPGKGNSFVSVEAKSDEALLKKIKRLEQENEILKKAMGIISRSDL